MNTETVEKVQKTVKSRKDLSGTWRLTYKLTNRMGPAGFSGRNLTNYIDPLTKRERGLYNLDGQLTNGYFIERQTTLFHPDENPVDANILDWLVGHPKVFVEQKHANLDAKYVAAKESNPRITLVNLDYQDVVNLDEEDYIDKLVGKIVLDSGVHAIGIEKLRFILAKLNLQYRDDKYVRNIDVEKPKLRKRLKDFVRRGMEQAKLVNAVLDNLKEAQYEYEIKEMIRLNILLNQGGIFKYEGEILGLNVDSVINYFNNNTDFYSQISQQLYLAIKKEAEQ
jgi:hypothetical protein